jgi:hypothetical protein
MDERVLSKDFYVYQSSVASIAAAANASDQINIQADSYFILQKLTFFADIAGAAQTDSSRVLPLVSMQITDTGSGRQVFGGEVPIPSIFGSGSLPFILPNPRKFAANSTIALTFTNFSAATTYRLFVQFIGTKVYTG